MMKTNRQNWRQSLAALALVAALSGQEAAGRAAQSQPAAPPANDAVQARGQELLRKLVEVNRYWLVGPPPQVRNFSYVLHRVGGTQRFEVPDPAKAPRARVTGVTYASVLQQLARAPEKADVRSVITEERGRLRLTLAFAPGAHWAIGNGVEDSWNGYHSFADEKGFVVLDAERNLPLEAGIGGLRETFSQYARVDDQHYVPLAITLQLEDTRYDWHFRLYEPGLWLFDESFAGGRRVAWVEQVAVNAAPATVAEATAESLARAEREKAGQARLHEFLKVNRPWLLPSLAARRGLVYEYRQEAPYVERVLIDPQGNLMARVEAAKDSPDHPTRQRLWLADGRAYAGDASDRFVRLDAAGAKAPAAPEAWVQRDRVAQHLAMGLALDCALTRLAREPEGFWAEVLPAPNPDRQYLLVLHPKSNARLFTGTMDIFSSWCYLHDVGYDRSEILCDAATHRPLEEKDYAGATELKGHYSFDDWLADPAALWSGPTPPPGAAPGRIRAVLPYEKDGKDQSLEMEARFHFARPGVWLLERVESRFRGGEGGSIGTLTVLPTTPASFQPIGELLGKAEMTDRTIHTIQQAPVGNTEVKAAPGEWTPLGLQAAWAVPAKESVRDGESEGREPILIGLHRARVVKQPQGALQVELEGVSTGSWKEFATQWKVSLRDGEGKSVATAQTNLAVRAESGPTPFRIELELGGPGDRPSSAPAALLVEGSVERQSGMYHGHGTWLQLSKGK